MKATYRLAAVLSVAFAVTHSAPGQGTYTFSPDQSGNQGGGNWSLANGWWNGTAWGAWQDGNFARFYVPSSATALSTITMNQNVSAAGLVRVADATQATVIAMAGNTLTLADGASILAGDSAIFAIQNGSVVGNNLTISSTGTGQVRFGHPTTTTADFDNNINGLTLQSGILQLSKGSGAVAVGGVITMNGGTVRHTATRNNQYAAGSSLVQNGGTIEFIATTQTLGSLVLNAGSQTANAGAGVVLTGSDALTLRNIALPTVLKVTLSSAGAQTVRFDAANNGMGTLRAMEFGGGAKTFNVENGTAATDLQITGDISETSASSLIKTGAGALTLSGVNNTYSGGTSVQGGELFAVAPGSLPGYVAGNLSVAAGATLRVRAGVGLWTSDDLDDLLDDTFFDAMFASGSTLGIDVAAGDPFVYANDLGYGEAGIGLLKTGAGTLDLTGGNTYTGTTEIRAGVLKASHAGALGAGGNITFSGGALGLTTASSSQDWSARFKNSTAAIALDLTDASATTTYSGVIDASNTGGLTVTVGAAASGDRTFVLSGNNAFEGPVQLTGAANVRWVQLNISSDGNLGVAPSSPTPGSISLDYARLRFTSSMTLDANRGIIVPNSSVVNRGEIVVLNAGDTVIYGGKIEGYQLRHTGPGTLRLTGTESTFSGDFMLQGNAVTEIVSIGNIGAPSSIGSGNRIQIGVSMAGGTLRYLGSGDSSDRQIWVGFGTDPTHTAGSVIENEGTGALVLTGNLLTQAGTTAARLLTLGGSNTDNNTFSGLIADHDTGAGGIIGLVKSGVGKWVVAGHQTYSGATTVSGGTLQITGSIQSSAVNVDAGTLLVDGTHTGGLITVKNGAVLGGGGTVRDVQFVEGSMFLFDPALTLTVEAGYEASFLGFGVYDLVNAAGASISTWGGTLGLGPYTLMDGTVDFSSGIANVGEVNAVEIGGGKSAYFQEGSLQLVVIPEPGSLGMLGLLAAAALLRRRLRRG